MHSPIRPTKRTGLVVIGGAGLLTATLLVALASPPPIAAASSPREPARSPGFWNDVLREVGTPTCQTDAQCRVAPVGARACGGPEAYVAWSTAVSDEPRLKARLDEHRKERERELERAGMQSDCRVLPVPAVACIAPAAGGAKVCTLVRETGGRRD